MIALMIYYDYTDFKRDIHELTHLTKPFDAECIVAIARGGMTLGHALAMALDIRNLQSIRIESYDQEHQRDTVTISGQCDFTGTLRVLIVDDIVDSGKTLDALLPILKKEYPQIIFKTAALFTKHSALIQPDFSLHEATDWIDFFWERDYLASH